MSARPHFTIRTRRGLKLLSRLVREDCVFAAAVVDKWPARDAHDLRRALMWIGSQPVRRVPRVKKEAVKA